VTFEEFRISLCLVTGRNVDQWAVTAGEVGVVNKEMYSGLRTTLSLF